LSPYFVSAIRSALPERDYGSLTTGDFLVGFARSKGYGDFKGTGWTVVVREAKGSAYLPAHQAAIAIGLSCLILGLALSCSAVLGTRFILRGLSRRRRPTICGPGAPGNSSRSRAATRSRTSQARWRHSSTSCSGRRTIS
jgi:hypothetical protein